MKRMSKRILAGATAVIMTMTLAVTSFAAQRSDTTTKSTSEFGTLTGYQEHGLGNGYARTFVNHKTTISKLSSTSTTTTLYTQVDILNYKTGKLVGQDKLGGIKNQMSAESVWVDMDDVARYDLVSSFGAHEARRSGSAVVYTELIGF